jgi:nucleoside recognition membrane protein YjiH
MQGDHGRILEAWIVMTILVRSASAAVTRRVVRCHCAPQRISVSTSPAPLMSHKSAAEVNASLLITV